MVAILDRCHSCGTRLADVDKFCSGCGAPRPVPGEAALERLNPQPPGGIAWSYRIPILNNRYTWIRWGWAAFWFGLPFAALLTTILVLIVGEASTDGVVLATKLFVAIALVCAAIVIGLGIIAALLSGNRVASRATLTPEGCTLTVKSEGVVDAMESVAGAFTGYDSARSTGNAMTLLLPGDGDTRWDKVRGVTVDPKRRVITLHRRWHNPLRLYVPADQFDAVATYVQRHVPPAAATPRAVASS